MVFIFIFLSLFEILFSFTLFKTIGKKLGFKKLLFLNLIPLCLLLAFLLFNRQFYLEKYTGNAYTYFAFTFYLILFVPKLIYVFTILIFSPLFLLSRKFFKLKHFSALLSIIVFVFLIYGVFWGSSKITVTNKVVKIKNLPKSFNNIKIVQLSDLHLGSLSNKFVKTIVDTVNYYEPDIIVFTGDIVNLYCSEIYKVDSVLFNLRAKIGKYVVLGNHDYGDYLRWEDSIGRLNNFECVVSNIERIGFKLLRNEHIYIFRGNDSVAIVGVENWGKPPFKQYGDIRKASKGVSRFCIVLNHDPTYWNYEIAKVLNESFTFSGHTHAFQFGFCFGDKYWSPVSWRYDNWWGLDSINSAFIYVSRGIGTIGYVGRICMYPEVVVITLVSND